jgi:glycosyltransferase involved in cell wall biosynthesis
MTVPSCAEKAVNFVAPPADRQRMESVPSLSLRPEVDEDGFLASLHDEFSPVAVADLTLVIPMFRESKRIEATIATLAASALNRSNIEFVFVDDGSNDVTPQVAAAAIETHRLDNARVLPLPSNRGKGGAIQAGVAAASGAHIGFLDADLSLDPIEVSRAFSRLQAMKCDAVVGDRKVDPKQQPVLRKIASEVFRVLTASLVRTGVRDTQCAMKLFRGPVAHKLFGEMETQGFAFDVELLGRARLAGYRIEQVDVAWTHQAGSSLNPLAESIRMFRSVLVIRRTLRK